MPYIKPFRRTEIDPHLEPILKYVLDAEKIDAGDLNYIYSKISYAYFANKNKRNYAAINDVRGALLGAGEEFGRRVTADYEDEKIKENGDILPIRI